ncbi:hypothetical protein [Clostridium sp. C2-6-12]|uniref:hypothetical protein n=1 Tax=Clostridium sp. C2-6-12 TaxID=2698832 RepID=UPI001371AEFB|nr:hypothetical protein [Clostridium sp. C2-6-12]
MSLSIDNTFLGNPYTSGITADYKSNNKTTQEFQIESKSTQKSENTQNAEDSSEDEKKVQKKMQITSEIEGQYYCTYLVDEEGQKTKISQVPIAKAGIQNSLESPIQSPDTSSPSNYNLLKDAHISFELKQQLSIESTHKQNVRDMMDLINGKNNSNDILGTLKSIRHLVM